jgi:hypothetical protein
MNQEASLGEILELLTNVDSLAPARGTERTL